MKNTGVLICAILVMVTDGVMATTYRVSLSGNQTPPYDTWDNAFTNLVEAVQYAGSGDVVLVTNGVYAITNALVITNAVTLQSVNGSTDTLIYRNLAAEYRCMFVSNAAAVVEGFTVTNGGITGGSGMGLYLAAGTARNCRFQKNKGTAAAGSGGGVYLAGTNSVVSNCVVSQNYTANGGGVACVSGARVFGCTVEGNSCNSLGGGVYADSSSLIQNCTIRGNGAVYGSGGGFYLIGSAVARNCLVVRNTAGYTALGAGAYLANSARLESCTVVANNGNYGCGGVNAQGSASILNCIIVNNLAPVSAPTPNWIRGGSAVFSNCCSQPLLPGTGNITNAPQFVDPGADDFRPALASPCIDTGTNQTWMSSAPDMDGRSRIGNTVVDMGAYEYDPGALDCSFSAIPAQGFAPLTVTFSGAVTGASLSGLGCAWDFQNDGVTDRVGDASALVVTNVYTSGLYAVSLRVTNAVGASRQVVRTGLVKAAPPVLYVATNAQNVFPYTNWATAATGVLSAVNAAVDGCRIVFSNGTFTPSSTLVITNEIMLLGQGSSSTGTVIRAYNSSLPVLQIGVNMSDRLSPLSAQVGNIRFTGGFIGLLLYGGTVTNSMVTGIGSTVMGYISGAAVNAGAIRNCVFSNNAALAPIVSLSSGVVENCSILKSVSTYGLISGAPVLVSGSGSAMRNCVVDGNQTFYYAAVRVQNGGIFENGTVIRNLTINTTDSNSVGGLMVSGGGVARNCIVVANTNQTTGSLTNWYVSGGGNTIEYSCTWPAADAYGARNVTGDPQFVAVSANNLRLVSISPCVNAGTNLSWMAFATDLAGNPRIINRRVDMGAYECTTAAGTMFVVR